MTPRIPDVDRLARDFDEIVARGGANLSGGAIVRSILLFVGLPILLAGSGFAQNVVTQAELLQRLTDLDRLVAPPRAGERAGLFSSYDRSQTTVENGRYTHWDADGDRGQFQRTGEDDWNVMAELEAPGALTRLWCEGLAGDLRIELDGKVVIAAPLKDFFGGAAAPFGVPLTYEIPPGNAGVSYFPIGFAKSCRVSSRGFTGEYQIDTIAYPPGTRVQTFTPQLDQDAQTALDDVTNTMKRGLSEKQLYGSHRSSPYASQKDLKGGEKLTLDIEDAGTIRGFLVSNTDRRDPRDQYALHNLILRVYWDGRSEPDIELPLPAFFGTGFTRNPFNGLVLGTELSTDMPGQFTNEGRFMYCYYPMPFQKGAHIEIENTNPKNEKIGIMLYLRVSKGMPNPDALRFKARMRTEDPCKTFDFPILETTGCGRLVGCVLNADCPRAQWWGTGDHKIWLDDEPFPSILGTSTSGFFGSETGLRLFRMPLQGTTLVNPVGKNSVYRLLLGDSVPFQKSIRFALENWQIDQANDVYYNSVVYWYGRPGAPDTFQQLAPAMLELAGLRIPGAVEIEGNVVGDGWGRLKAQKYAKDFEYSGEAAAMITTDQPVRIEIPCETAGKYILNLRVQTGRFFDKVTVKDAAGKLIGVAEYNRESDGRYRVGEIQLEAGRNTVEVQCARTAILDCWILEKAE